MAKKSSLVLTPFSTGRFVCNFGFLAPSKETFHIPYKSIESFDISGSSQGVPTDHFTPSLVSLVVLEPPPSPDDAMPSQDKASLKTNQSSYEPYPI